MNKTRKCITLGAAAVMALTLTAGALAEGADPALVRETTNGPVQGFVEENGACVWLGVPYGQADRWAAPQAPESWKKDL